LVKEVDKRSNLNELLVDPFIICGNGNQRINAIVNVSLIKLIIEELKR
jgi:hypothetical protein